MESKLELWLFNQSKADVSISDLGVKVPVGKVINVYKVNPYLTLQQVEKSMKEGALAKRLSGENSVLKIVKKGRQTGTVAVSNLKQSKEPIKIKKTKSSVVLENASEAEHVEGSFEFADYGLNVSQVKDQASVFVKAKEDNVTKEFSDTETKPKVDGNVSKQSAVVMDTMVKNLSNPVGPLADTSTNGNQTYIVTKAPAPSIEVVEKPKSKTKVAKEKDAVMVGVVKDSVKKNNVVKRVSAESDPVVVEKTEFDAKVATKSEGTGAVVMELMKEVPKETAKKSKSKTK